MQDDKTTFLLPRPEWVNDMDVSHCESCNDPFGPLRRRHHCRHCGNIFCHDCSSKNVPLPQLGYGSKPVRVCKGCFEVAYLVTYAIDDDHGVSTQIHGVRGLLELIDKGNERDLHSLVAYGGIDALIWLCRSSTIPQIHQLVTTILAILAEKESVRPIIITKWALPALLHLIGFYKHASLDQEKQERKSPTSSLRSGHTLHHRNNSHHTDYSIPAATSDIVLDIIINCTHVLYQLARAGILSQTNIISEGILDTFLDLAVFEPTLSSVTKTDGSDGIEDTVERDGVSDKIEQTICLREGPDAIQTLAAKGISAISGQVSNQPCVIELLRNTDKFAYLLRSPNANVQKYAAKTIAYLSLRNDKYKPALLKHDLAQALVSIIALLPQSADHDSDSAKHDTWSNEKRLKDLSYYASRTIDKEEPLTCLNTAAVSHACCALANFGTNYESQANLIAQPHLLKYICNVPVLFPDHTEIHGHIARCLANFALYEENNRLMLACTDSTNDGAFNVIPRLVMMGQKADPTSDIQRHIVRAIDNLSAHIPNDQEETSTLRREAFNGAYPFIQQILEKNWDVDVIKRAQSIIAKAQKTPDRAKTVEKKEGDKPKGKRARKPKSTENEG